MLHCGGSARAGAGAVPVPVVRERPLGRAGLAGPAAEAQLAAAGPSWPPPGLVPAARLIRSVTATATGSSGEARYIVVMQLATVLTPEDT
jgi:hypothetical protein